MEQINARLPEDTQTGSGEIVVVTSDGKRVSAPLTVAPVAPGIFRAGASAFGLIYGVAGDGTLQPTAVCSGYVCQQHALEARTFSILVNGLGGRRDVRVAFAEQPVEVLSVMPADQPGVQDVRVRLSEKFRLQGYIPVTIAVGSAISQRRFVRLK